MIRAQRGGDVVVVVPSRLASDQVLGLARLVLTGAEYAELARSLHIGGGAFGCEAGDQLAEFDRWPAHLPP